jgi:uncharacterized protein (TIGR02001 family)
MIKSWKLALCAAVASVAVGGTASAQEDEGALSFSWNIGAASDYVFRGVSQTGEDPQVFGGIDFTVDKFYAGAWASNVDFGDETDGEVDVYAGFKPTAGPVNLDFGVIYYGYINEPDAADWSYWEFKAAGSVAAGPGTVGAAIFYSPDFTGAVDEALYYEVNGSFPINDKFSMSGALGRQEVEGFGDYTTWNVGLGLAVTENVGLDLRYHDTDEHDFGDIFDSRVVLGVKASF